MFSAGGVTCVKTLQQMTLWISLFLSVAHGSLHTEQWMTGSQLETAEAVFI